ncbi:WXG100 family type VII secretion target [Glycomyces sp. NRRL B-16210]|uniref:WXG100 family type VII secretion target n=1 Tax=Glycomyces sp. NRRL B-16210 TaxID=1463821 RepID=UPI0004BF819B|nr:hypothetical protein [Glycomyces sp. NRRL B-16210]
MAGKGKGKAFYKNKYTHQELWTLLGQGDDFAVERAGSIWTSAASGMKAAREELDTHVTGLRTQWTGPASDEFDNRMAAVKRYSVESENGMKQVGETVVPSLAAALKTAQDNAVDLNPTYLEDDFETWVLSKKNVEPGDPRLETNRAQWEQQWRDELDLKHDQLAEIVANLGDVYAQALHETFSEPPPPPPSDMPGNATYQPPTGGVFAEGGLNPPGSIEGSPATAGGSASGGGASLDTNGDGVIDSDDLDPVENGWNPGSYDDIDSDLGSGGLASATVPTGGGPTMGTSTFGGSSIASSGGGLFPAGGATTGGNNAPGRGGTSNSPARAGAANNRPGSTGARSGGTASGRGAGGGNQGRMSSNSAGGRNALNRGGSSGANNGRGGTRSGYSDDDDDETYTRETWLREDDVNWGRNNVRSEELDED